MSLVHDLDHDAEEEMLLLDEEFDTLDLDVDFYEAHILPQGYIPQARF